MKVSIIISAYNAEKTIAKTLDSVFSQIYADFFVLVIDDGSTDRTGEIVLSYMAKHPDKIRVIRQKNKGLSEACNLGLREVRGEYIVRVDADDTVKPEFLSKMVSALESGDYGYAYCDYNVVENSETRTVKMNGNVFRMLATNVIFKKEVFDIVGGYPGVYFEEYDLMARVVKRFKGVHVPFALYTYYRHDSNMTGDKKKWDEGVKELRENHAWLFSEYDSSEAEQYEFGF